METALPAYRLRQPTQRRNRSVIEALPPTAQPTSLVGGPVVTVLDTVTGAVRHMHAPVAGGSPVSLLCGELAPDRTSGKRRPISRDTSQPVPRADAVRAQIALKTGGGISRAPGSVPSHRIRVRYQTLDGSFRIGRAPGLIRHLRRSNRSTTCGETSERSANSTGLRKTVLRPCNTGNSIRTANRASDPE